MLDQIDSTNNEAARIAGSLHKPTWIFAHRQMAGRGRRGRAWVDPIGNFAASYITFPNEIMSQWALRSFVAALALFESLADLTHCKDKLSLKWPNDVLLNGDKVAGILLETCQTSDGRNGVIVGVGVNLISQPNRAELEPGSLAPISVFTSTGITITPTILLHKLAENFEKYENQLITHGFDPIRQAFLENVSFLGQPITARIGEKSIKGRFETIDIDGQLILNTDSGVCKVAAGDIYFQQG